MNCQPGDLAVIVNAPGPQTRFMVGKIVKVTRLVFDGEPCWEYEGKRIDTGIGCIDVIEDEFLRPIRADGVTHDEVRELYAPEPTERADTRKPVHGGYPELA
jgi:hypothetical protein